MKRIYRSFDVDVQQQLAEAERVAKTVEFSPVASWLLFEEPVEHEAEEVYAERLDNWDYLPDQEKGLLCFIEPLIVRKKIKKEKKKKVKKPEAKYASWSKKYHRQMEEYENNDRKEEDEYIVAIQSEFPEFPVSDEFAYVFKQYRLLREFLSRLRLSKCHSFLRRMIDLGRIDIAKKLINRIEADSRFLDSMDSDDFDGVCGISPSLMDEILQFISFDGDEETEERWLAYFNFFTDPRGEFSRLRRIWDDTYLHILNTAMLQAMFSNQQEILAAFVDWEPVKNCAHLTHFKLNPFLRMDIYYSKRGSKCPHDCSGHRGRSLLMMISMNNVEMVQKLLDNGVSVSSNSCGGNCKELYWKEIELKDDEFVFDFSKDDFDVEAYEQKRKQREENKLREADPVAFAKLQQQDASFSESFEAHPHFDDISDSDDDDTVDSDGNQNENVGPPESDWRLIAVYEKKTAISCAVDVGDVELVSLLLKNGANPLSQRDAALRAISQEGLISFLTNDGSASANVAGMVAKKAKDLFKARNKNLKSGHKIPNQRIWAIFIAQVVTDARRVRDVSFFFDTLYHYFQRNGPPNKNRGTLRRQRGRGTLMSQASVGSRRSRSSRASSVLSGTASVISTSFRSVRNAFSRTTSRVFRRRSRNMRGSQYSFNNFNFGNTLGRRSRMSANDESAGEMTPRGRHESSRNSVRNSRAPKPFKYSHPHEEFYYRVILAVDYLRSREMNEQEHPYINYLRGILHILENRCLLLDVKRMKAILKILLKAVMERRFGGDGVFRYAIFSNTAFKVFFGIATAEERRRCNQITDFVVREKAKKELGIDNKSYVYKKVGRKLLVVSIEVIAKQGLSELATSIITSPLVVLKKNEVEGLFEKISESGAENSGAVADAITEQYPEYFEIDPDLSSALTID